MVPFMGRQLSRTELILEELEFREVLMESCAVRVYRRARNQSKS
jgi:hypothetical protein